MSDIRINQKSLDDFNKTLRDYARYTKRTVPVIVNTKAYYIARRAVAETPSADKENIAKFIGLDGGRIAGMIINKGRGLRNQKGLYGSEMRKAVVSMKARRMRARAFIKSGWLWAVKKLAPLAEKRGQPAINKKGEKAAKAIGQAKGYAVPAASDAVKAVSLIANTVTAAWDKRQGAAEVAIPALERAFEFERQSMIDYIKRKMQQGARAVGIRTN